MAVRTYRSGPWATDAAGTVHTPRISEEIGESYRVVCSCGRRGPLLTSRPAANDDLRKHLSEMSAVPEAARCRMPRRHRLRPWEACGLCEGQLDLLDLLENEMEETG